MYLIGNFTWSHNTCYLLTKGHHFFLMNLRYASTLVRAVKAPPAQTSTPAEAGPSSWFLTRVQMKIFTSSHMKVTLKSLEGKKKKVPYKIMLLKSDNRVIIQALLHNFKKNSKKFLHPDASQFLLHRSEKQIRSLFSEHNTITAYKLVLFFFFLRLPPKTQSCTKQ